MSSGRKKQILSLLKWRKGKKQKVEKEKVVIPDDTDFGSCQPTQTSSLFRRSQSEDSGLDLSNSSCLFQKQMQSDRQENTSIHSRHTSNSSGLYSYLSYDSRSALFPRTHSFTTLSGGEHEFKATASSLEEDDDVFGLNDITQTVNTQYNLPELTEPVKSVFTVTDVAESETEKEEDHRLSSNNWCNESKWKTQEDFDILESQPAILGFHEQVRRSGLESKVDVSRSATKGLGMLYRICNMMEKITELERDRLELLRQNNELQGQLSQSQQAEVTFLSCCTCGAGAGVNTFHSVPRQITFSRQLVTRKNPTTEITRSQVSLGPSSEANTGFEQSSSSQHKFTDVAFTFTQIAPETLNLGSNDELQLCVSRV